MRKFDLDFTWFPQKYDSRVANFNFIIEQKLEKTIYSKRGKEYAIYICTLRMGQEVIKQISAPARIFFYIDGVYTIIDMATAYGTALGFDSTKLLLALLVTQIVAFPLQSYLAG